MSISEASLEKLRARGISDETFWDNVAIALKGEIVETEYRYNKSGERYVNKVTVTSTPDMKMKAAMLAAGILGLKDESVVDIKKIDEEVKLTIKEDPDAGSFRPKPNRSLVQTG